MSGGCRHAQLVGTRLGCVLVEPQRVRRVPSRTVSVSYLIEVRSRPSSKRPHVLRVVTVAPSGYVRCSGLCVEAPAPCRRRRLQPHARATLAGLAGDSDDAPVEE